MLWVWSSWGGAGAVGGGQYHPFSCLGWGGRGRGSRGLLCLRHLGLATSWERCQAAHRAVLCWVLEAEVSSAPVFSLTWCLGE